MAAHNMTIGSWFWCNYIMDGRSKLNLVGFSSIYSNGKHPLINQTTIHHAWSFHGQLMKLTFKVLNFWKFTSYCGLKPLWSGMGEVVTARTSPTLHPPSPPTVHQLSWLALLRVNLPFPYSRTQNAQAHICIQYLRATCIIVTSTLRVS